MAADATFRDLAEPFFISLTERIKALQSIQEKEKKWLLEQELVDKKEKELQKLEKRKMLADIKTVHNKKSKGNKREVDDKAIEMDEFNIGRTLEQYDHLVNQFYENEEGDMFEIVNVFSDKSTGKFMSTAWKVIAPNNSDQMTKDIRIINGVDGTIERVNIMMTGKRVKVQGEWPSDVADWKKCQEEDEWCKDMIVKIGKGGGQVSITKEEMIDQGELVDDKIDFYFVEDGLLKRCSFRTVERVHNDVKVKVVRTFKQIMIPRKCRDMCMYMLHDRLGHPGRERTLNTIKLNYQWIGIGEDVKQYIQNCRFCKLRKADNFRAKVPIQEYNRMGRPLDRVHADLAGPFQPTEGTGFVYVLIIKDALTKFMILVPLLDKSAETVTKAFTTQVLSHYGPPKMLITDKGTDFVNKQMKHWCKVIGTVKKNTTPANPRSDGLAENAVKTMKDMLVSYINVFQTNWDKYLALIQYDYNTTVNIATGYEPYFLMFGRTANRVDETLMEEVIQMNGVEEYGVQFSEVMDWIWKNMGDRVV